jgi:hypothetical protein
LQRILSITASPSLTKSISGWREAHGIGVTTRTYENIAGSGDKFIAGPGHRGRLTGFTGVTLNLFAKYAMLKFLLMIPLYSQRDIYFQLLSPIEENIKPVT